ncbi:hypothetical protein Tco_0870327 [Tanacetum coccineum]
MSGQDWFIGSMTNVGSTLILTRYVVWFIRFNDSFVMNNTPIDRVIKTEFIASSEKDEIVETASTERDEIVEAASTVRDEIVKALLSKEG